MIAFFRGGVSRSASFLFAEAPGSVVLEQQASCFAPGSGYGPRKSLTESTPTISCGELALYGYIAKTMSMFRDLLGS